MTHINVLWSDSISDRAHPSLLRFCIMIWYKLSFLNLFIRDTESYTATSQHRRQRFVFPVSMNWMWHFPLCGLHLCPFFMTLPNVLSLKYLTKEKRESVFKNVNSRRTLSVKTESTSVTVYSKPTQNKEHIFQLNFSAFTLIGLYYVVQI